MGTKKNALTAEEQRVIKWETGRKVRQTEADCLLSQVTDAALRAAKKYPDITKQLWAQYEIERVVREEATKFLSRKDTAHYAVKTVIGADPDNWPSGVGPVVIVLLIWCTLLTFAVVL